MYGEINHFDILARKSNLTIGPILPSLRTAYCCTGYYAVYLAKENTACCLCVVRHTPPSQPFEITADFLEIYRLRENTIFATAVKETQGQYKTTNYNQS